MKNCSQVAGSFVRTVQPTFRMRLEAAESARAGLEPSELKVDPSFMRDTERDAGALAIATAAVRAGGAVKRSA